MLTQEQIYEIRGLFKELYPDRQLTSHIQVGPKVYLLADDIIIVQEEAWEYINRMKNQTEIAGSAQGEGVETIWWDSTDRLVAQDPPLYLKFLGNFVREEWDKMVNAVYDEFYRRHPEVIEKQRRHVTIHINKN